MFPEDPAPYDRTMSWLRRWWAQTAETPMPMADHPPSEAVRVRTARDWTVDAAAFVVAVASGVVLLSVALDDTANRMTSGQVAVDAAFGLLCCLALWWRRRWPLAVALVCVLLGALSTFGTVASLIALSSLAIYRHVRPALLVAALFVPSAVVCSLWLGRSDTWAVILPTVAIAAAAVA